MRAVVVSKPGGPEAARVVDVPTPRPGPGEVRIRVGAASVNPVDAFVRSGLAARAGLVPARDVLGLGWDVAGAIDQVGEGVTGFAEGDAVVALSDRLDRPTSGYAEQIVLDADAVAAAPANWTIEQAATLPLNGLTAAQALDLLDLRPGQTLLVTGAAGAVGGYAVELATAAGLLVVGSSTAGDEALVRGFGARWFVPRGGPGGPGEPGGSGGPLGVAVRALVPGGVDGVLDAAVLGVAAHDALRGGGGFVSVRAGGEPPALRGSRVHNVFVRADGRQLAELVAQARAGRLTPRVAETFPLDKVAVAHRRLAEGGLRGRLVLIP
jgi:NADPH:quinone reductase-like Zn-dependent oxidoreductase